MKIEAIRNILWTPLVPMHSRLTIAITIHYHQHQHASLVSLHHLAMNHQYCNKLHFPSLLI